MNEQVRSRPHLHLQNNQLERSPLAILTHSCNQEPYEPEIVVAQRDENAAEEDIPMLC